MDRSIRFLAAGFLLLIQIASASGQLVIQELLYDGPGADGDDVFTELVGPPGLSLDGWSLVGINGDSGASYRTVDLSGATMPADGVLVVATAAATGEVLAARDLVGSVDWQNGPDAVHLLDALDNRVDAVQYGDAGPFNSGEGVPATTVAAGQSLAREAGAVDTDDNFADFSLQEVPTPGLTAAAGLTVAIPDTVVAAGDSVDVDLRLKGSGAAQDHGLRGLCHLRQGCRPDRRRQSGPVDSGRRVDAPNALSGKASRPDLEIPPVLFETNSNHE